MKSMQRMGGKMMKRSADQADVGTVIAQFKATEDMLDRLAKDLKTWRDGWDDILRLQYNASEAFAALYKQIEPVNTPEQRHQASSTPPQTMQKCLALQKMYSDMKVDLQQEIQMITNKIMLPLEDAGKNLKKLKKTIKHRENTKLDYERYLSRAEHSRNKGTRTPKEEANLAEHESKLQQAQIDYQTADEQVKTTFPPVSEAVMSLLPCMLANQVMIQTTIVGQIYTNLDEYCRSQGLPSPAPGDDMIIREWDDQFTGLRKEMEQELKMIANGKAAKLGMSLPEKDGSTYTGLGIRNKTSNLVHRSKSNQSLPKPITAGRADSAGPGASYEEEEEAPPPKPPRPGVSQTPSFQGSSYGMPSPAIPMGNKPRMPSYGSNNAPYDQKATNLMPSFPSQSENPPPPYSETPGATPPSRYQTPINGLSPNPSVKAGANDYFGSSADARRASAASFASGAASVVAAAKKKPPPPVPAKRLPSQQAQFVVALYDFEGQGPGDLAFREGDRIRVVKKTDSTDDWWDGELGGRKGAFPANYVQL